MQVARMRSKAKNTEAIRDEQWKQNSIAADVLQFYKMQQNKKKYDEQFDLVKKAFYERMEECDIDDARYKAEFQDEACVLKVKKVQRKTIVWNVPKLLKKLKNKSSKIKDQVFSKKYYILDIEGLVAYLKECDVDPKIFKSFLEVDISVNESALNNLHAIGKIQKSDIKGCYELNKSKPYWTVKRESDEETE